MRSQTRYVGNKGITQFLPATHTRAILSVLPSRKATTLWPVPSCTAWLQRHIHVGVRNLPRVFTPWCPAETRTCDLLIASPTLYRNTTTPPHQQRRWQLTSSSALDCLRSCRRWSLRAPAGICPSPSLHPHLSTKTRCSAIAGKSRWTLNFFC